MQKWVIFNAFKPKETAVLRKFRAPKTIAIRYFNYLDKKHPGCLELRTKESFETIVWRNPIYINGNWWA